MNNEIDKDDDLSDAIKASHPTRTGDHATYARAMQLVGNRHSKRALIDLVNYLLTKQVKVSDPESDALRRRPDQEPR